MLKMMSLSTIQFAPKIYRSKAYIPRQTSLFLRLFSKKYRLGYHDTTSEPTSKSKEGKISSKVYFIVCFYSGVILKQDGRSLPIRHFSGNLAQEFDKASYKDLKLERGRYVKVDPESMKIP